ncbi:MAG: hypothetical protein CMK89_02920 [Pseudomonadales bacterium]|nr:hypothetical protein [Pseudomonadales bacterium]
MRISGDIQSYVSNGLQGREDTRLQQQSFQEQALERARQQEQRAPSAQQEEVQISEAARQASAAQQIVPTNRSEATQSNYQYYRPVEQDELPSSKQRALQAYTTTQQISREAQGSGEFLGSIDLFV